jgi:hypothetical protein
MSALQITKHHPSSVDLELVKRLINKGTAKRHRQLMTSLTTITLPS